MKKQCIDCTAPTSKARCKPCGYKARIRPSGLKYNIKAINKGWFKFTGGGITGKGYIRIYRKEGSRYLHDIIMEQYLGRSLTKDEVVHHINGDKTDNRIENLQLLDKLIHDEHHRGKKKEGVVYA